MTIPLNEIISMPASSPYYPIPPALYRHAKFYFVYFHADPLDIDRILPECFTQIDQGSTLRTESQFPGQRTMELLRKV